MRHQSEDVTFEIPDDWEDRSVTAYAVPMAPGQKVASNVVVIRDKIGENESAAAYADRQLVELAKRLSGFDLIHRRDIKVAGQPAVELAYTWVSPHGPLEMRQIFVVAKKRTVLNFTATAAKNEFGRMEPGLKNILASVKLPQLGR